MPRRPFRMALSNATVRLHKTDATGLLRDEDFELPAQSVGEQYGDPFTLRVQPRWPRYKDQSARETGDDHYTYGWLGVSHGEIADAGLEPADLKNAQITGLQRLHGVDQESFVVTEVRPRGHLRGGPVFYMLVLDKLKDTQGAP